MKTALLAFGWGLVALFFYARSESPLPVKSPPAVVSPAVSDVANPDCCLIPANRGLYRHDGSGMVTR
jgi:hypothetical protein